MGLEDYFHRVYDRSKAVISGSDEKLRDYLTRDELKNYFDSNLPEEERAKNRMLLDQTFERTKERFRTELSGLARKTLSRGTMGYSGLASILGFAGRIPIPGVHAIRYTMGLAKAVAEIPALYRYFTKTHDFYGVLKYELGKPIRYLLPGIGEALESGAFDRMVRKRLLTETKQDFLREIGKYQTLQERVREKSQTKVGEILDFPTEQKVA